MSDYLLPDVGEGLTEAEIVSWKVAVGDEVKINDVVVEIETAKSLVELPSPYAGVVVALMVPEGETVAVGTPIIRIDDGVAAPTTAPVPELDLSNPAATGAVEGESLVGRNKAERAPVRRARVAAGASFVEPVETPEPVALASLVQPAAHVLAKPPVRKLAKDLGVDLASCAATGPNGTVSRADVEDAASDGGVSTGSTNGAASRPAAERERREPIKGVRKMMGAAMVASAFTAPHVTEWITVDVTRTSEFVERVRGRREFADVKVTPLLILAAACLRAARRTPVINSTWDEASGEVVFKSYVNLGIAAATPRGLVVPNIKDAETLSLLELAGALGDLTAVAREGRTQPADMAAGTFTITNVGVFGVDGGTPIINPGESAILCFGATKRQPWVVGAADQERLEIRDVCTLALSFDHRHVDGESGSRFLADVASMMEDPAAALLF
ncbi:MAG TPA: dihydrolipoamide acetyltransferase family protein [Marmoricola sp.]|jgi:pyruvate dehydrogenase E2 component (dihydrolipoamide acetyltransferase)|nr:dihydrolipoamide acetyltransferase family protein [Marmoricola sp.]